MAENTHGGAPRGGPGGGNRDNRGGGGDRRGGGKFGGPRKGGPGGRGGPAKPERRETYESLKELTRGEGFRIDKYVVAEKQTHKPVKTEYRLTREGLKGVHTFPRLADAQIAATAPLPEPEPEVVEEIVEVSAEDGTEIEAAAEEAPAENESAETVPEEPVPEETGGDSVEHVADETPAAEDTAH